MGKKATKKFAAKGQLKQSIQARHKNQQIRRKVERRKGGKGGAKRETRDEDEEQEEEQTRGKTVKGMTVDDFLGAGFMEGEGDSDDEEVGFQGGDEDGDEDEDDEDDIPDDQSFASVDDLEDPGEAHLVQLSKLAEKDPEFYKYLQENDRELLSFDPRAHPHIDEDDTMSDGETRAVNSTPVLSTVELGQWQKALLEHRSLRALRKLLLAFRAAVHMNEDDQELAWRIDSSSVYKKLVTTSLKYTPMVLDHHVPCKILPNGKFKPPTQTAKLKPLQKMIQSFFLNVIHLLDQLTDSEMIELVVTESARIIPWVISSRRAVKLYLKKCLELWSIAEDSVRLAAFLAIRRLASSSDQSILDQVLKGTYLTLVRTCKSTSAHTLPSVNLMKNSAAEIFCIDHATAYQHAFGYIRQLAIHLRESIKVKTKEAYKQVYNWQYVHCVDFWSIVLAQACDKEKPGKESELQALIYPLVQVSLGAIKLISNARSFPFHLHILRSLLHLTRHTYTYIPLASYVLPILSNTLVPSARPKPSTLRPLDLDVVIRAPQQYLKTRVYSEVLVDETTFVLAEWLSCPPVLGSVAFPEMTVGVVVMLRKSLKAAKTNGAAGKEIGVVKALVEKLEESAKWVQEKRKGVPFGPGKFDVVEEWEAQMRQKTGESPLGRHMKIVKKAREKRKALVEKARDGEDEILED